MFLSDGALRPLLRGPNPILWVPEDRSHWDPIQDSQIQPASIDVRLGCDFISHRSGDRISRQWAVPYVLTPGACVLGSLIERARIPDNMLGRIEGKSSLARKFLTIHSAGFLDPGFTGDVTLEIKNDSPVRNRMLYPGMLIAQICFALLDAPAERPYGTEELGSRYQGQRGPTEGKP